MKPFKEVIDGIRKAVMASEVREDLAQMGEYVEQFANTAGENIQKAIDPTLSLSGKAADAKAAGDAIQGVRNDLASEISRAETAEKPTLTTSRLKSSAHKPPKAPYPLKSRRKLSGQRRWNRRTRTGLPLKHPAPRARSSAWTLLSPPKPPAQNRQSRRWIRVPQPSNPADLSWLTAKSA